jgi:PKD repeat protein
MKRGHRRMAWIGCLLILGLLLFGPGTEPACGADFNAATVEELTTCLDLAAVNGQDDTITLAGTNFLLTTTLNYDSTENNSLTIQGTAGQTVIDGQGGFRILKVATTGNDAHVTIRDIIFQNGFHGATPADYIGGGLHVTTYQADIFLQRLQVLNSRCSRMYFEAHAGGAFVRNQGNGLISITDCHFEGNSAISNGGGLYLIGAVSSTITLVNNSFLDNNSSFGGGAMIRFLGGTLTLTNNTFTGNEATNQGGGLYLGLWYDSCQARVYNNIIWGNTTVTGTGQDLYLDDDQDGNATGSNATLQKNDYHSLDYANGGNLTLADNLDQDPALDADLHLTYGSPCMDQGDSAAPALASLDQGQKPRLVNGVVDMGAHEFPVTVLDFTATPNRGKPPLSTDFSSSTFGTVTDYQWSFGDTGESTLELPTHEYAQAGRYTVTLTVSGPNGTGALQKTGYVSASDFCLAPILLTIAASE